MFLNLFKVKGFSGIADAFEKKPFPPEAKILKTSVQVGPVRYRQCASILLDDSGIYIGIKYVFKTFPVTFIPWKSIKGSQPAKLFGSAALGLCFTDSKLPPIVFYLRDIQRFNLDSDKWLQQGLS